MNKLRDLFQGLKDLIRKIIPHSLIEPIAVLYRRVRAWLAAAVFGFPGKKLKIIGITGTNGKTTTSAYLGSILEAAGNKVAISSTAFFQIGDEKWLNKTNFTADYTFQMQKFLSKAKRKKVDYVILEITAHGLDQKRGLWGVEYLAAVMTNLTQDHLDYFKTMENYAAAKYKLFATSPPVIALNKDDEWFDFFNKAEASEHKITYGTNQDANVRIDKASLGGEGSEFKLIIDKSNEFDMSTKLIGKFNVYNAAAAVATTYALHIDTDAIVKGVANLASVPGRMEIIEEGQKFAVIVDYAHTPDALKNILETVKALTKDRVILVFGATGDRDKEKRPIMGGIAADGADRIVLTDEEPYNEDPSTIRSNVMDGIEKAKGAGKTTEVADRREAIARAFSIAKPGDTVVITGMGHQSYMKLAGGKIPWDDREVAREELKKRA